MRKTDCLIWNSEKMYCYAVQKGLAWKYELCSICKFSKKGDAKHRGTPCGILNTLSELGDEMGFKAPVFYCKKFEKDE